MKKLDFHIHTVKAISDNKFEFSIDTLKRYIDEKKLDAIAITNHNIFDNEQFELISNSVSIPVFPGIEIDIEKGHLLLITELSDLKDFIVRCQQVKDTNCTPKSSMSEESFLKIFPDLNKYLLIPHYDKSPELKLDRIPNIRNYIYCGEVTSVKKFISMKKDYDELVPVIFSDQRMKPELTNFSDNQTFIDINEITLKSIKQAQLDRTKFSHCEEGGTSLFQILDNGLKISSGLTVVLGSRSSGKSHTLDAINEQYKATDENSQVTYIKQFDLLVRDEKSDKQRFDELLKIKGDSINQQFLLPFKHVVEDVQNVNLNTDMKDVEDYICSLKKAASEYERQDTFSKAKIFNETLYDIKDLKSLLKLIHSLEIVYENIEYREIINEFIDRKNLIQLLIKLKEQYIVECRVNNQKKFINDLVSSIKNELGTRSTNTSIPDIDFYEILMNKEKVNKFNEVVKELQKRRIVERKTIYSFTIEAIADKFYKISDLHTLIKTNQSLSSLFDKYNNPYEYLLELKNINFIAPSDYYKWFVNVKYEVLNRYGTKASGGERSEFNLLQKLNDAAKKDILILDEPESSFDNIFLKEGVDKTLKVLSTKIPVIIATHNSTIGASVHPDYLLYTNKHVDNDGKVHYQIYSGFPTSEYLEDLEGNKIERRIVMLDCLEAGEKAYTERSKTYEVSIYKK